jgi:hypothetical protein
VYALYRFPFVLPSLGFDRITLEYRPAQVLKQILVMFRSACDPAFTEEHPGLSRYLLNKDSRELPRGIEVFISLYDIRRSTAARQSGMTGRLDINGSVHAYSEISFPPLNLIMTPNQEPPDGRLRRITWFADFALREKRTLTLDLCNLPVCSYLPADYSPR